MDWGWLDCGGQDFVRRFFDHAHKACNSSILPSKVLFRDGNVVGKTTLVSVIAAKASSLMPKVLDQHGLWGVPRLDL
jgi:hypothetical protein